MIQLAFMAKNRDIVIYEIENKVVRYMDRMWQNGIQIMPKQEGNLKALKESKSQLMQAVAKLIEDANSGKNLEEYNAAQTDEDLAAIIRRDAALNGLIEVTGK